MRSPAPRLLLAALALLLACTDDPAADAGSEAGECLGEPAPFANGELIEWFGFGHDFSEFCSAGYQSSEDHARWVAQAWGREPAPIHYELFESEDDPCWPCPSWTAACVTHGRTASRVVPDRHELVHAVRPGSCPNLLEEGYAMLYGGHFEGAETIGDIRLALLESYDGGLSGGNYPLAARFVAFLLETRGVDELRELCEIGADSLAAFEDLIVQIYGVTFEDLATEFDTYPEWSLSELRQDQACESDDVIVGPAAWDFHFACGAPGVEGKLGVALETQRLVELPQEDIYQFVFESSADVDLEWELRSCARDGMASTFFRTDYKHTQAGVPEGLLLLDPYPAGVYVLRVRVAEPTAAVELHMSVETWP